MTTGRGLPEAGFGMVRSIAIGVVGTVSNVFAAALEIGGLTLRMLQGLLSCVGVPASWRLRNSPLQGL